jgi:hypothetical protein
MKWGSRNKAEQTVSAFGRPWEVGIQAGQPEEAVYGEEWRVWACVVRGRARAGAIVC